MSRKTVYKLPTIEKAIVLDSKFTPSEEEEKEKLLEDVAKESYQKGWEGALKKNQEDIKLLSQSLKKAIEDVKKERDGIWDKCEKEIIKLTFAIAKKTVYEEVSKDSSKIIERVISEALNKVKENKIIKIHLNPEDIEKLKVMNANGFVDANKEYEVVSDIEISRGGCKVVTDCGGIDARLETRWDEITSAFGEHTLETESVK